MLEIICAGSLFLSLNICQNNELIALARENKVELSHTLQPKIGLNRKYLAKGRPHQSRYRREADRARQRHGTTHEEYEDRGRYREGRIYRDADEHRRNRKYERHNDDRYYRYDGRYRRDDEYERETRDRYYRRSRSQGGYIRNDDYYRH